MACCRSAWRFALVACAFMMSACGAGDGAAAEDAAAASGNGGGGFGDAGAGQGWASPARGPIPEECWGFPLEGLRYSPGGETLPNKCEEFHPTWNNPYAVRCIDAYPDYDTGYPGDEYCILPPPPDKGIQIGFHPQGPTEVYWEQIWAGDLSGYRDLSGEWLLAAGSERTDGFRLRASNTEPRRYYRTYFRMRTGAHHGIYTVHHPSDKPTGWAPELGNVGTFIFELTSIVQNLGGQQRLDDNIPVAHEKPPEDEDVYFTWPANPEVLINVHSFNPSDTEVLREGWTNLWWEPEAQTEISWYVGLDPFSVAVLRAEPGEIKDFHYAMDVVNEGRLMSLLGHRHAWATEFLAWIERANGDDELIYRSLDWADMPTYRFDSVTQNPPLASGSDGGASGILELHPGDRLHFNCHVEFTDERAAAVGAPMRPAEIGPISYDNNAFTAEMCSQFGAVRGLPFTEFPVAVNTPVPDFD